MAAVDTGLLQLLASPLANWQRIALENVHRCHGTGCFSHFYYPIHIADNLHYVRLRQRIPFRCKIWPVRTLS